MSAVMEDTAGLTQLQLRYNTTHEYGMTSAFVVQYYSPLGT
jgi:hypothetical protein